MEDKVEERRKAYMDLDRMFEDLLGRVDDASKSIKKHDVFLAGMSARMEVIEEYGRKAFEYLTTGGEYGNGVKGDLLRVKHLAREACDRVEVVDEKIKMYIKWPAWIVSGAVMLFGLFKIMNEFGFI